MEEILQQIKDAEVAAKERVNSAEREAALILSNVDKEIEKLNTKYIDKLKDSAQSAYNDFKSKVNEMHASEAQSEEATERRLKERTRDKIMPCVDFVYDYILKEFA